MRDPATRDLEAPPSLRPVGIAFVSLGLFFGTWAVTAADTEDALGLGHGAFGALLAVALVGTVTTSTLTGALVERFGTGAVLGWGAAAFAVATAAIGLGGGAAGPPRHRHGVRVLLQRGGRRRDERGRRGLPGRGAGSAGLRGHGREHAAQPRARKPLHFSIPRRPDASLQNQGLGNPPMTLEWRLRRLPRPPRLAPLRPTSGEGFRQTVC